MPRLVKAPISLVFSEVSENEEMFEREFQQLNDSDDNPINQWLKLAKARGETAETDPVLLNLLVELHNKVDALEMFLKNEEPTRISLIEEVNIQAIGFEHFEVEESVFQDGTEYYARVTMPVHPKRDIPVFFIALSENLAEIKKMHERDEREWNSYMTARERVLIREAKERK